MTDSRFQPGRELAIRPNPPPMAGFTTRASGRRPAVIADANALIADSIRHTRGLFSIMPFLAERGLINLLTAEHIDAKVYARLPDACENAHADVAAAKAAYETVHRRHLRLVDVGGLMLHDARVGAVALADEEDVPVAQLGVLLAPSLVLTQDSDLIDAGIGVHDWADALVLVKELIDIDDLMRGTTTGLAVTGGLAACGIAEFVNLLRRSDLALGITIGLAVGLGYHFRAQIRTAPERLKESSAPAIDSALLHVTKAFERREAAERRLQGTLMSPHAVETLEAVVARILVQQREPRTGAQVHAELTYSWRHAEVKDVMSVLRENPPFRLIRGRGWVLGRPAPARR